MIVSDENMSEKISFIVTSVTGLPALIECISSLMMQIEGTRHEVIVSHCLGSKVTSSLLRQFPNTTVVEVPGRPGIPHLRAAGFDRATAEVVAFIGEHYAPDARWCEIVAELFETQIEGVGGPIEMACPRTVTNWAVYLCEYSGLMLPAERGEADGIAGNNCAYRREVLDASSLETLRNGWEYFLQQELRAQGVKLHLEPAMVVWLKRNFTIRHFLSIRFDFSRSFAAMRRERLGSKALLYVILAPALFPLMFLRIATPVFAKRRYRREFIVSSPLIALFCISAALGEATGYLLGSGASLGNVE
jgi:hypothetical protein